MKKGLILRNNIKKILVLLVLTKVLFADEGWIEIPSPEIGEYTVEDYTMRDDIDYVELRKALYSSKTDKSVSEKYIPYFKLVRKPLNTYSPKVIKDFRRLKFQKTDLATIAKFYPSARYHYYKVNGFIIKKDGSFLVFNEDTDIGWLFNGIDNFAELIAYMDMRHIFYITQKKINGQYVNSLIYRKTDNGYEIKRIEDKGIKNNKETLTQYHTYDVHLYTITKNGKLTERKAQPMVKEKVLTKEFFKELENQILVPPVHADPIWAFYSEEELVEMELKNPKMVTPY